MGTDEKGREDEKLDEKSYEIKGYGTVSLSNKGLVFRVEVSGQVCLFIITPERSVENLLLSIEKTLKAFSLSKSQRGPLMRAIAEVLPTLPIREAILRPVYVPFWATNGSCYEAVKIAETDAFLTYDHGQFSTVEFVETPTLKVIPTQFSNPYQFDSVPDRVPSLDEVYKELHEVMRSYFAYPDHRVHKFLALYLIHSYMLPRSLGTIFLWFIGAKRTGKTTFQLISESVGYRPFAGVGTSEAALYRTLGYEIEYAPLIIIKEFERASDLMKEVTREGDIPGTVVPRADKEGDRMVVRNYHVYGSRVVASNKLHGDDADMDRYHLVRAIKGRPARPRVELYRNKQVLAKLQKIRNDLLLWKVARYGGFEVPSTDDRIPDGRDWEHYGGIITLAGMIDEELKEDMYSYIVEYLKQKTEEEKSSSLMVLTKAILELADMRRSDGTYAYKRGSTCFIPFEDIWQRVKSECTTFFEPNGNPSQTKVTGPDGKILSTTMAGKLIKEQLLGQKEQWREGKDVIKGYSWSEDALTAVRSFVTGVTNVTGLDGFYAENKVSEQNNETENKQTEKSAQNRVKPATPDTPVTGEQDPKPTTAGGKLTTVCWQCGQVKVCDWHDGTGGVKHAVCDDCWRNRQ
ncbi:MAG: hypothetical protein JRN68_06655 [Nitrososphaerota archaeon]|nr:hypothetical protein [Nitrososphaerota archaeon]